MFFAYSKECATLYYNLMEILKFENMAEFIYKRVYVLSIFSGFVKPAYQQRNYNTRFAINSNFMRSMV